MLQQEALMAPRLLTHRHRNLVWFVMFSHNRWSRTQSEASIRKLSACCLKVYFAFFLLLRCATTPHPPFSRGLGRVTGSPADLHVPLKTAENNHIKRWSLECCPSQMLCRRTTRSLGLLEIPQVCPDVFLPLKWSYIKQNTICCVHLSTVTLRTPLLTIDKMLITNPLHLILFSLFAARILKPVHLKTNNERSVFKNQLQHSFVRASWAWVIPVLYKSVERCSVILHTWFFSALFSFRGFVALQYLYL